VIFSCRPSFWQSAGEWGGGGGGVDHQPIRGLEAKSWKLWNIKRQHLVDKVWKVTQFVYGRTLHPNPKGYTFPAFIF
jgi:hypothetical protein